MELSEIVRRLNKYRADRNPTEFEAFCREFRVKGSHKHTAALAWDAAIAKCLYEDDYELGNANVNNIR
jgi:hypothetical protein